MPGTVYIFEHKDRPGQIHVGMTKGSVQEDRLKFSRLAGLSGHPRLYAKIKVQKPRHLLRTLLISLVPYRVTCHFHRIDPDHATDLLIHLANRKGKIQSVETLWPSVSDEDQTFMRLMNRAKTLTRNKKYRKANGKKGSATVIDIRKLKKGKKGKKSKFVRAS
jgi:hypothetical protein